MLLLDLTHTSHTRARTGIQRVCRSLFAELPAREAARGICFDPHLGAWRPLDAGELAALSDRSARAGQSRGARWSLAQKISGHARRLTGRRPTLPAATGLVCPELFSPKVAAQLPALFAHTRGPRVALFHDAIGLKFPELTPPGTVARLPGYLRELLQFDGIAAVSEDSAASLRDFWSWLGVTHAPPVQVIPLGIDPVPAAASASTSATDPKRRVLCVSTVEGRKNHLALLDAAETLWREGVVFELELIGLARADTAAAALNRIRALQAAGRALVFHGSVSDAELQAAYQRCAFTVYPSLVEGFGLPVLESLQHGKPCICAARGALGESARGGGCVVLHPVDSASLAAALRRLLGSAQERDALAAAARGRTFRTWSGYADDLGSWMKTLKRRD
ncbi:MAG: glycosyltransferase family 4 protein [Opitutae bacterium]|nr:glycosyltransferase family 4 protein [Opitutae bacterium]